MERVVQVRNDVDLAISSWKSKDFLKSGYAVGNLIGILVENGRAFTPPAAN